MDGTDGNGNPTQVKDKKHVYVSYDYFKRACQMIQSVYSKDNNYAGYHSFMHYWAMNGDKTWISFTTDGGVMTGDWKQVNYTYLSANYWNTFDPTDADQKHPYALHVGKINW